MTERLKRPSLIVREAGEGASLFVVVHESYYGVPKITAAKRLEVSGQPDSVLALQIETRERTDVILISLDDKREVRTLGNDPAFLRGCAGLISTRNGQRPQAWLIGGTELRRGLLRVTSPAASYDGAIESVSSRWDGADENAFLTSAALPAGDVLRGSWMIVTHGEGGVTNSFEIERVEVRAGKTRIILKDDPGLRVSDKATTEIFFPRRKFTGENRFVIYTRTATE